MDTRPTVYVETTVPSYLVARPSRDALISVRQQMTRDWWAAAHSRFQLVVSEAVMEEIQQGDPAMVRERVRLVSGMRVIAVTPEVRELAHWYEVHIPVPAKAKDDALHLACAVVAACDFLVTWNCSHLANAIVRRRLAVINAKINKETPTIATPEELQLPSYGAEQ